MAKEEEVKKPDDKSDDEGPGAALMGRGGILLVAGYIVAV